MFLAVPSRTRTAHVVTTRRTSKHTVQCTYLLLRSQREDGKVRNETQGNRSRLPDALIGIILLSLQGETFFAGGFQGLRARALAPHGHLQAVALAMQRLGPGPGSRQPSLQVNDGPLTDAHACAAAVSVFEGNTSDSLTFLPAVQRVREHFRLAQVATVGDRGPVSTMATCSGDCSISATWPMVWRSACDRVICQARLRLGRSGRAASALRRAL